MNLPKLLTRRQNFGQTPLILLLGRFSSESLVFTDLRKFQVMGGIGSPTKIHPKVPPEVGCKPSTTKCMVDLRERVFSLKVGGVAHWARDV